MNVRRFRSLFVDMRRFPVAVVLCLVGCDHLPFVGSEDETPRESSEDEQGSEQPPKPEAAAPVVAETKSEAETKTGIASTVSSAVAETPEGPTEPIAKPTPPAGPLAIDKIHAEATESYGGDHSLDVTADAVLREDIDSASVLWVKARCSHGDDVYVQMERASPTGGKDLGDRDPGDVVVTASFDGLHVEESGTRCELEFRVASMYGGPSIDLGTGCWDGTNATTNPCTPRIEAVAASGAGTPLEIGSVTGEFVGLGMLSIGYEIRANEPFDDEANLEAAVACNYDGTTYVEGTTMMRMWGPFTADSGETFSSSGHILSGLEPATTPDPCDLTLVQPNDARDELEILHRGCLRGGKVATGTCDGATRPAASPRKQVTAGTVDFELVAIEVTEAITSPGQLQIEADIDASIKEPVLGSERLEVRAECKFGGVTMRDDTTLQPPVLAESGQRMRYDERLFTLNPFDKEPKRCRIDIVNTTRTEEVLATFCWRRGAVKKGTC